MLLLAQGWSDHTDATLLRDDPALRLAVSERRGQRPLRKAAGREPEGLCSQPTLSRLLAGLGSEENLAGLRELLLDTAERRMRLPPGTRLLEITLDLDSVPVEVFGHQPGSGYNGHYRMRCYHPLVVRSDRGDFLGARLRPGQAGTASGGMGFVKPVIKRVQARAEQVWLRMDAGFPEPGLLKHLEDGGIRYVARLKSNAVLGRLAAPCLNRPPGRPPTAPSSQPRLSRSQSQTR